MIAPPGNRCKWSPARRARLTSSAGTFHSVELRPSNFSLSAFLHPPCLVEEAHISPGSRVGKDEHRRVAGREFLAAHDDAVRAPLNRQTAGDALVDRVARRIAEQDEVAGGDVLRGHLRVVLRAVRSQRAFSLDPDPGNSTPRCPAKNAAAARGAPDRSRQVQSVRDGAEQRTQRQQSEHRDPQRPFPGLGHSSPVEPEREGRRTAHQTRHPWRQSSAPPRMGSRASVQRSVSRRARRGSSPGDESCAAARDPRS